jgi:cytochrome c-type biogenesis protein CcmH
VIWLGLLAAAAVIAMAVWAGRTTPQRVGIAIAAGICVGAYWMLGSPGMPDQPLSKRLDALEARAATDAESLTLGEVMAIAQHRAKKNPKDPESHKIMGDILQMADRRDEAMLAYQAALRRDPTNGPALVALADLRFKSSGALDATTNRLYQAAYAADPSNPRVGYMSGIAAWQEGRQDEARSLWSQIEAAVPAGDPRQQMFRALRETFVPESLGPAGAGPSPAPGK